MHKKIICLILVLFFCIGCSSQNNEREEVDYRTGSEGNVLNFVSNTPNNLYENENPVSMTLEIRNKGAFPQPEDGNDNFAYLWLGGFDQEITELSFSDVNLDKTELEGKSIFNDVGGYANRIISGSVTDLPDGITSLPQTIQVSATYEYETIANPLVCIDPNPRSTNIDKKVCSAEDYSSISLSSQGAPVAVTSVKEEVTSKNIIFRIYIKNVGNGRVIGLNKVSSPPYPGYSINDVDKIEVESVKVGTKATSCTPTDGIVKLIGNEGYIVCRLSTDGTGVDSITNVYLSPLTIKLKYGYLTSINKNINILEEI